MKTRKLFLIVLLCLCVGLLAGCRCEPSGENWYIQNFHREETFVNGVTHTVIYSGVPSAWDPYGGMEEHFISIDFENDGTVVFCPGTGETLTGTYTFSHSGISSTDFTVTLENGEQFTGNAQAFYYGSTMSFVFREQTYVFKNSGGAAKEYYDNSLRTLTESIRYWAENQRGDIPLKSCSLSSRNGKWILTPEDETQAFFLDDTVAVRVFRLDGENVIHALDQITEGECFYVTETSDGITFVTIYYVDP